MGRESRKEACKMKPDVDGPGCTEVVHRLRNQNESSAGIALVEVHPNFDVFPSLSTGRERHAPASLT